MPLLLVIALTLAIVDASCYFALALKHLHLPHTAATLPGASLAETAIAGLPQS